MKTLSSRSIAVAEAIRDREPFKTYGALKATSQSVGRWDSGRLTGDDHDRFRADMATITYVVWSYNTPIAWVANGVPYRVRQKFSMTTSHHQGKLYLLGE